MLYPGSEWFEELDEKTLNGLKEKAVEELEHFTSLLNFLEKHNYKEQLNHKCVQWLRILCWHYHKRLEIINKEYLRRIYGKNPDQNDWHNKTFIKLETTTLEELQKIIQEQEKVIKKFQEGKKIQSKKWKKIKCLKIIEKNTL